MAWSFGKKASKKMRYKIAAIILFILWMIMFCLYMDARPVLKKMNGQTFGIPDGWHLEVREDTGETLIVQDAPMEMRYGK